MTIKADKVKNQIAPKKRATFLKRRVTLRAAILTRDLSILEDNKSGLKYIQKIAEQAGKGAVAEARVAGLARIYSKGGNLVSINKKGKETIIESKKHDKQLYVKYKPATKLYVPKD